jgi:uncharacterized membrane protein
MKKHLQVLLAGVVVVIPFAISLYIIYAVASWLGKMGGELMQRLAGKPWGVYEPIVTAWGYDLSPLIGAAALVAVIYLIGWATHLWFFRAVLRRLEQMVDRVPGIKTVYESVRDLLKLFGGSSAKGMGRAVLYRPPNTDMAMLGILTNERPAGTAHEGPDQRVAVYLPLAYMIGGPIVYIPRSQLQDVDIPVERVLKLCATAEIGAAPAHPLKQAVEGGK